MISTNAPNGVVALHHALVHLADDRLGGDRRHHLPRALHRLAADGGDGDEAAVVDVISAPGLVLNAADGLALGTDEVADLLRADLAS